MIEKGVVLGIGCDHAGYLLKEFLLGILEKMGYKSRDFGTFSSESVDYPDFGIPLCRELETGHLNYGILICGTGNGMSMTANKFRHIRAALCWNREIARLARQHNNANILVLPARFIDKEEAALVLEQFLMTDFEGGRHSRRIEKMMK